MCFPGSPFACGSLAGLRIPKSCVLVGANPFLGSFVKEIVFAESREIGGSAFEGFACLDNGFDRG
jgi:hypothetical protein